MTIRPLSFLRCIALSLVLVACSKAPESTPPPAPAAIPAPAAAPAAPSVVSEAVHGIAWQTGDVDAVFAAAKKDHTPVFLYWGAKWCPPCNQVTATIFNRQDFIERSRHFAPVYVDGDSPSAQRLGSRFKVSGYPTMILFTPDGSEITRLPGEVDADQYMRVLAMGMNGARPIRTRWPRHSRRAERREAVSRPKTGACCPITPGAPTKRSSLRRTTSRPRCNGSPRRVRPTNANRQRGSSSRR
jgi:thioredoxin-related protein